MLGLPPMFWLQPVFWGQMWNFPHMPSCWCSKSFNFWSILDFGFQIMDAQCASGEGRGYNSAPALDCHQESWRHVTSLSQLLNSVLRIQCSSSQSCSPSLWASPRGLGGDGGSWHTALEELSMCATDHGVTGWRSGGLDSELMSLADVAAINPGVRKP
jgi:hypothetical protein